MQNIITIIPIYNEASRLQIDEFIAYGENNPKHKFLFVDDGSTDNSVDLISEAAANSNGRIILIKNTQNLGKAETIRNGVNYIINQDIECDYFGYLDADLASPLSEINFLVSYFANGKYLMVFGSRIMLIDNNIKRTTKRHYFGRIFTTFVDTLMHLNIYDTQCGAKYFANTENVHQIFSEAFISRWFFDIEIFLRIRNKQGNNALKQVTKEVPLNNWEEKGNSKLTLLDFLKTPINIIKIYWHYRMK